MGRRREKSRLQLIAEAISTEDLRLRVGPHLVGEVVARATAHRNLIEAHRQLGRIIESLKDGTYP